MSELAEAQERLDKIMESEVEKITLFRRFEMMSNETNVMLKEVGVVLNEVRKNEGRQSIASSRKSRSSRGSTSSTTSSAQQCRIDQQEELASLRQEWIGLR